MISIKTSTPFVGFVDSRQGGRAENQDSCGYADTVFGLLVVVCDGMGGGPGGKVASSLAVDSIIHTVRAADPSTTVTELLQCAVQIANQTIINQAYDRPSLRGMGTTAAILLIGKKSAVVAHVGDSRIYQFRDGKKKYRTVDHSVVAELVRNGTLTEEQARLSAQSNVITRGLGVMTDVKADIVELPYEKGDRFMLCTDGIWGAVPEKELVKVVAKTQSLGGAVERVVIHVDELGFSTGGNHDNLTVALIETTSNSILKEKMSTTVKRVLIGLTVLCCLSIIGNIIQFNTHSHPVQNKQTVDLDSLVNVKIKTERERMESKFQETIESLSQMIEQQKVDSARRLLDENMARQRVVNQLDTIIGQLEELKVMKGGKLKEQKVGKALISLKTLTPELQKYGIQKKDLVCNNKNSDDVVDLLTYNIAKDDPNSKSEGHYNAIIKILNSVRYKISNE